MLCPHCGKPIHLTEAFKHQIEGKLRADFERTSKKREEELREEMEGKLRQERARLEEQVRKKAQETVATELTDLKSALAEKEKQVEKMREEELALRRAKRELEERESNLKVEVARKIDEERRNIEASISAKLAEQHHMKDLEKDKQISDTRRQVEELQRKLDQGSQQAQGEVMEEELEATLRRLFPHDDIRPVEKGQRGADVIQEVKTPSGRPCGLIVWESKRTKNWSDGWVAKLKDDQIAQKADLAVIVSEVLPKGMSRLGNMNGVWVCDFPCTAGLASALRASLIQLASARAALVGKGEKMELVYNYLSSVEFRQKVEAIVEGFVAMKTDLDSEKRAMDKIWSKREAQIQRVLQNTARMYGDLQGIVGAQLPAIKSLELPE